MEFGVCMTPEWAEHARKAGFTFIDQTVAAVVMPAATDAEFERAWVDHSRAALPTLNLNCLLPGGLFVAGPQAELAKAVDYCSLAFQRAGRVGIKTICFGSGNGRRCPEGWPMARALEQIHDFIAKLLPAVEASGVKLVVENLQASETNTLNQVADIVALVSRFDSSAVGILVDGFHWSRNEDKAEAVAAAGSRIFHTHIATYESRLGPGLEMCDFSSFADALTAAGYRRSMAIEGACRISRKRFFNACSIRLTKRLTYKTEGSPGCC